MGYSAKIIDINSKKRNRDRGPRDPHSTTSAFGKSLTDVAMTELTRRFSKPVTGEDYRNRALFLLKSKTALRLKKLYHFNFLGS
ncbi:hypothetical protein LEP1GSC050_4145 [Leptospira broomii serovar Hurstbridge str. 5399]|uniref:Uncharacterized protein n=1 Tax=Leptospira broomii serovar Hurstbridge str. 5399 TaxID=1049789 RepID=T0FA17_9LEPT|nr:hypothetical protein LEP1GSC050_4145 [Leptospira broomii serovar Hurstbridge str. 5399]